MADLADERPPLTNSITLADFRDFYWLKQELVDFCREQGLPTAGSKIELHQRIERFLLNGLAAVIDDIPGEKIETPVRARRSAPTSPAASAPLSLDAVITENYKSDQAHREFFKTVIGPHFHFTTHFMRFCRENVGKTYREAVAEWYAEQEGKKDGSYKTTIAPQFEYNQFIRDFCANNPDKSLKEAIAAWKATRQKRGSNKYQ